MSLMYICAGFGFDRGTKPAEGEKLIDGEDIPGDEAGPVKFTHDPRLVLPSHLYHSPNQVLSYIRSLRCPTLLVMAGKYLFILISKLITERCKMM